MSKIRLIAVIAAVGSFSVFLTGQEGSPQPVVLAGIDVEELACVNIKLLVPDGLPKVTAEQARETASAADPFDLPVQQVAPVRLVQGGPNGLGRDNLVWVVVLGDGSVRQMDVPGPGLDRGDSRGVSYTYAVVLVDALTGEFIFEQFGPLPPGYACPS